ncbi:MAG: hypothetical protein RMJ00_01225 [Nitrososphaerota archaeon]|nr:hypothetical protein [Candidatus Bathyarchaeota archaeon]MDW8061309.1 hypothetical protein [Nitrososphaerota archaeon]
MPQRIICKSCGYILYEGDEFVYPGEIVDGYGELCPSCKSKITFSMDDIRMELKPAKKR